MPRIYELITLIGFFYIINFGFTQAEVDRQFSIGKQIFNLPLEEKLKYRADLENGGYNGYKPAGLRVCSDMPLLIAMKPILIIVRNSHPVNLTRPRYSTSQSSFPLLTGLSLV